jgi:hypoxanthine phosphoribosyltransferase
MQPARVPRPDPPLKRILGWADITRAVDQLTGALRRDYDAILVVTRGGMVPACLISERLDLRNILVAAVQLYTGIGQTLTEPVFLQFPTDILLAGKSILIVDDVWDSGRTAVAVRERVKIAGGRPEVAVMHYKPGASRFPDDRPDYFAEITEDWIVYPWDEER